MGNMATGSVFAMVAAPLLLEAVDGELGGATGGNENGGRVVNAL